MLVLGIESSCDETAAAVVADGREILSNVVSSQVFTHAKYGGVVPELASREHLRKIVPVISAACRLAGVDLDSIDGVAVTEGPGLIGSLLVGLAYGKALAFSLGKALVGVNHLEGHIHAVLLENEMALRGRESHGDNGISREPVPAVSFPAIALVVSGGHTSLFRAEMERMPSFSAPLFNYTLLGRTRDDAAGEAFDKVAKLLALGYPGGPIIDRLARFGNPDTVPFGQIKIRGNPLDFSFSGLKTAVLYRVRGTELEAEAEGRRAWRKAAVSVSGDEIRTHCSPETLDLIASFQNAVVSDAVERTMMAAEQETSRNHCRAPSILVSGGVACNSLLRERFLQAARDRGLNVFFPSLQLATDNAAMIAAAGYFKLMAGARSDSRLTAHASLPFGVQADQAIAQ